MRDPAAFSEADTLAVFGGVPRCFFTLEWNGVERHHVLGRGEEFGIRPDHADRFLFSSPLNCSPLIPGIHKGPMRDDPYVRAALLDRAERKVREAVRDGKITWTEREDRFRAIADGWRRQNGM